MQIQFTKNLIQDVLMDTFLLAMWEIVSSSPGRVKLRLSLLAIIATCPGGQGGWAESGISCASSLIYFEWCYLCLLCSVIKHGEFQSRTIGLPHLTTLCRILIMPEIMLNKHTSIHLFCHWFDSIRGVKFHNLTQGQWTLNSNLLCHFWL